MTPSPWCAAVAALVVCAGCGTLAPDGGATGQLPSSGAGPYRPLDERNPLIPDYPASLDDAVLLVDGEALTVYCTRRDAGSTVIVRARFTSIEDTEPVIATVLAADRDYEAGSVSQPELLDLGGGHTMLAYTTGEATIGYAISDDGETFHKAQGPARRQRGEFAAPLSSPALLALDEDRVRLLYIEDDYLHAAETSVSEVLALGSAPFGAGRGVELHVEGGGLLFGVGRTTARTVVTSTGRRRFDLFFSTVAPPRWLGFAGSFDGTTFARASVPLLDPKAPEEWAPSGAAWRGGTLLVYSRSLAGRTVLSVAANP